MSRRLLGRTHGRKVPPGRSTPRGVGAWCGAAAGLFLVVPLAGADRWGLQPGPVPPPLRHRGRGLHRADEPVAGSTGGAGILGAGVGAGRPLGAFPAGTADAEGVLGGSGQGWRADVPCWSRIHRLRACPLGDAKSCCESPGGLRWCGGRPARVVPSSSGPPARTSRRHRHGLGGHRQSRAEGDRRLRVGSELRVAAGTWSGERPARVRPAVWGRLVRIPCRPPPGGCA